MTSSVGMVWLKCFNGPHLYRLYRNDTDGPGRAYIANAFERHADSVLHMLKACVTFSTYLSPLILAYFYRRDMYTYDNVFRIVTFLVLAGGGSWLVRGLGRLANQDYVTFARALLRANENIDSPISRQLLHRYDFGFYAWPVDYRWNERISREDGSKSKVAITSSEQYRPIPLKVEYDGWKGQLKIGLEWLAAHSIGRRMLYPGSLSLMQVLVRPVLDQGRTKLFEDHGARRYKLQTSQNLSVESVFVDKRKQNKRTGHILVITCEGNAGYLEIGCMSTPLELGFSVLGWNHPGFGGSEGVPWPEQEKQAVEVVVQFALEKLNWEPENVVMLAWSIGGYTATWAAKQYPQIGGVVLDATFDDLLPLAEARMPASWRPLIEGTVRKYLDLPISPQLQGYQGPVQFIRRSKDEVICTGDESSAESQRATNRGNDLLIQFLTFRYPNVMSSDVTALIVDWLKADEHGRLQIMLQRNVDSAEDAFCRLLRGYVQADGNTFPMGIGDELTAQKRQQMGLYLAAKYMEHFNSNHCTPLEARFFHVPKHPWEMQLVD